MIVNRSKPRLLNVLLIGGLGNQLFQITAVRYYAKQYRFDVRYVTNFVDRDPRNHSKTLRQILILKENESWSSDENVPFALIFGAFFSISKSVALTLDSSARIRYHKSGSQHDELFTSRVVWTAGYFQDKFYLGQAEKLLLLPELRLENLSGPDVSTKDEVLVHVRGGDYTKLESFGCLPIEYYRTALASMGPVNGVLIITDDERHAEVIRAGLTGYHIDVLPPNALSEVAVIKTFFGAKRAVIANSSFSFWAAYLGAVQEVYFPRPWFRTAEPPQLNIPHWHAVDVQWKTVD